MRCRKPMSAKSCAANCASKSSRRGSDAGSLLPRGEGGRAEPRPDEGSGARNPRPSPSPHRASGRTPVSRRAMREGSRSGRAGGVERVHVGSGQRKLGCARKALGLFDRGGAGDRRGDAGPRHGPGQRDLSGLCFVARRYRLERVEDAKSTRIEIGLDPVAARTFGEIGLAAVLAREEPLCEAEIGDDADLLALAEVSEGAVEFVAVGEIVFWLENLVARQSLRL